MAGTTARRSGEAARASRRRRPTRPSSSTRSIAGSGLAAVNILKRAGRRLGFFTVRELLFHLPRRYDDLREMRQLGELAWVEEGTVVSARVARRRRPRRAVVPAPDPADDRGPRGRDRDDRGDLVRAALHRAAAPRRRQGRRVRQAEALRPEADPRQPRLPARGQRRRDAPRRADRAGLPAHGRADGDAAADRDARRPRSGRQGLPGVPAAADPRGRGRWSRSGRALEEAHYPASFEGRDAALRRLAFDELLALQLGMVGRRRQRGRDAARPIAVDDATDARPAARR